MLVIVCILISKIFWLKDNYNRTMFFYRFNMSQAIGMKANTYKDMYWKLLFGSESEILRSKK
jgi:hypothetical protein